MQYCNFVCLNEPDTLSMLHALGKKRLGIDMYVLLHWALAKHPEYHETLSNHPSHQCPLAYSDIFKYLQRLVENHMELVLVYDGRNIPFKISEADRFERRRKAKEIHQWNNAYDIDPIQAHYIWSVFSNLNEIKQMVAPFEADAQLAYLYHTGKIDAVLTCDTDLIFYGVKDIIFKTKDGMKYYRQQEGVVRSVVETIDEIEWERKLVIPILVGNDYTKGVRGYGIKKAITVARMIKVPHFENGDIDWNEYIREIYRLLDTKIVNRYSLASMCPTGYKRYFGEQAKLVITAYTKYPVFKLDDKGNTIFGSLEEVNAKYKIPFATETITKCYELLNGVNLNDIMTCTVDPNMLEKY